MLAQADSDHHRNPRKAVQESDFLNFGEKFQRELDVAVRQDKTTYRTFANSAVASMNSLQSALSLKKSAKMAEK